MTVVTEPDWTYRMTEDLVDYWDVDPELARQWAEYAEPLGIQTAIVIGWIQEGFTIPQAEEWRAALDFSHDRPAVFFSAAGYTPQHAASLLHSYMALPAVAAARVIDVAKWLEMMGPWVGSGIDPDWVCCYVAAGVSLEDAQGRLKR